MYDYVQGVCLTKSLNPQHPTYPKCLGSVRRILSAPHPLNMLKSSSLENPNQRIILKILWVNFFHKTLRLTTHEQSGPENRGPRSPIKKRFCTKSAGEQGRTEIRGNIPIQFQVRHESHMDTSLGDRSRDHKQPVTLAINYLFLN